MINKLVAALTLYFGAHLVIAGTLTVGEFVAFNMLAGRVAQPVLRLAQVWQDFHQARLSIRRLGDILNATPEPTYSAGRSILPDIRGSVNFEHVSFRYRLDGPKVLETINLQIPAGQVVGIVGSSGSGKSTLTKLLQRLYVPENGALRSMELISGWSTQVGCDDRLAWSCKKMCSSTDPSGDNIALANPAQSMKDVVAAAKMAGAHDFILELPNGYDTIVGERGSGLSGGQRQRIAIARALIGNPRILILDEATSALDYESERVIQENMRKIAHGRTVLIIAHRLSAVRHADRIITLERGRVVEDGNHDQLVRTNGRYAALYRLQAGFHEVG